MEDSMAQSDFGTDHLNGKARGLANAIVRWLTARNGQAPYGGGCRAFYSAKEWRERGEDYGTTGVLVLVHDGGDLAPYCSWDYCQYAAMDDFRSFLEGRGYYVEQCTSWYSAIYPI
jgi:hypothetical protein